MPGWCGLIVYFLGYVVGIMVGYSVWADYKTPCAKALMECELSVKTGFIDKNVCLQKFVECKAGGN